MKEIMIAINNFLGSDVIINDENYDDWVRHVSNLIGSNPTIMSWEGRCYAKISSALDEYLKRKK